MKLASYQMLEAFRAENWRGAIEMLRQHFCLQASPHLCYEVIEHEHNAECVEIRQDKTTYYWHECDGFHSERRTSRLEEIYIYCRPPVKE